MRRFIGAKPVFGWAKRQGKLLAGITAGLIVGGSAVAFAAIPDAGGVIHACYRTSNGSLRVIDDATTTCASNETAITWNQTGPQGPIGATGPVGPQGPAGSGGPGSFLTNFVDADLTRASLHYRNFTGVDMHGAILSAAYLTGSDFSNANLSDVFIGAASAAPVSGDLSRANFSGANFTGATIANALKSFNFSIDGSDFRGANFTGATMKVTLTGAADFRNANFTSTIFDSGFSASGDNNFSGVDFSSSIFTGTGVITLRSNLSNTNFNGITFSGTFNFNGSDLTNASFSNATHGSVLFEGGVAAGTNFTGNHFAADSSFEGTDLSTADLTGVTWSSTICPDSTNSDNNGNTCIGHLVP